MRTRRLHNPVAIAFIFFFLVYHLSSIARLFVVPRQQDIILPFELASKAGDTDSQPVPKIIHQVFLGFDNSTMPYHWQVASQKCIDLHPDYEYVLWTCEAVRDLLETKYPWFLNTFDNYKYNVQRADSIRYFILAEMGGTYIDLDDGCKKRLDPLLQFDAWMPGVSTSAGLSNHVMASSPSHPYFRLLIDSLPSYDRNYGTPYLTIMGSAGPHMVSFVWKSYLHADPLRQQPRVRILMPGEGGLMEDFFATVKGETWHTWDVKVFRWASHHLPLVVLVGLSSLLLVATLIWVTFWSGILIVGVAFRKLYHE